MQRRRVIVGAGEALLLEGPEGDRPAGLALLVPIHAARLGHEGIVVSRIGQDRAGEALLAKLGELDVDCAHLQTDPDLATVRIVARAFGGERRLDAHAAYDYLQWDFDLTDVAQRTDAVVYGWRTRRSGQSRSTIDRFLEECELAVRVFDLTGAAAEPETIRTHGTAGLVHAGVAVVDEAALRCLLPGAADRPASETARELMRRNALSLVLVAEQGRPLEAFGADAACATASPYERRAHEAMLVGLLHGLLSSHDLAASMEIAERIGRHAVEHPDAPPPRELLEGA